MRKNDGVSLALELLQIVREIDASPPNAFGAEIYPRAYHRLIWRFSWVLQTSGVVEALVPKALAADAAAATAIALCASRLLALRDRTRWRTKVPPDTATSIVRSHHARQPHRLRVAKKFSTGYTRNRRSCDAARATGPESDSDRSGSFPTLWH